MNITEIRVKIVGDAADRLKAYCSVTLDDEFVVRDLKIIDGPNGLFVAMPSRRMMDRCPACGGKNHLRARFCNDCGAAIDRDPARRDRLGRLRLHADVAHPINSAGRERIQREVLDAYENELVQSQQPGYRPADGDADDAGPSDDDRFLDELRDAVGRRSRFQSEAAFRHGVAVRGAAPAGSRGNAKRTNGGTANRPSPAESDQEDPFSAGIF